MCRKPAVHLEANWLDFLLQMEEMDIAVPLASLLLLLALFITFGLWGLVNRECTEAPEPGERSGRLQAGEERDWRKSHKFNTQTCTIQFHNFAQN
jgi:hypothetical protein